MDILKSTRLWTGSQCSWRTAGVIKSISPFIWHVFSQRLSDVPPALLTLKCQSLSLRLNCSLMSVLRRSCGSLCIAEYVFSIRGQRSRSYVTICVNVTTTEACILTVWHPGARFSKNFTMNLWKIYEKIWLTKNLGWVCDFHKILQNLMKNLGQSYAKLMIKLNDDITRILRKLQIRGMWYHSENPLSEAVVGRILWAKNNWLLEWRFPENAFEKWLIIFLQKS